MQYTFGLIGSGNMGGAIARAASHTTKSGILADHFPQRAKELAQELGLAAGDNQTAARESQYLFLGVKPHLMGDMLTAIQPVLASRDQAPVLVSMAAGLTIAQIQQMAGQEYPQRSSFDLRGSSCGFAFTAAQTAVDFGAFQ